MLIKLIYKSAAILLLAISVQANAYAQNPYAVLLESTHKFSIPKKTNNTYLWSVYKVADWSDKKDDTLANAKDFNFVSTNKINNVDIRFINQGKYYVVVEETNEIGCSSRRSFAINVMYGSATAGFEYVNSTDCSDSDSYFAIKILSHIDQLTPLSESNFPIKIKYKVNNGLEKYASVKFADKLFIVEGIVENINEETINKIQLIDARNKYGGKIKLRIGKDIHTRKIFKKPEISNIKF